MYLSAPPPFTPSSTASVLEGWERGGWDEGGEWGWGWSLLSSTEGERSKALTRGPEEKGERGVREGRERGEKKGLESGVRGMGYMGRDDVREGEEGERSRALTRGPEEGDRGRGIGRRLGLEG